MSKKVKQPIPFEKILQYYTSQEILYQKKEQLGPQIQDMLTITNFLINKIPFRIKYIKSQVKQFNDNLRQVIKQFDKIFMQLNIAQHQMKYKFNPILGYDIIAKLSHERMEDYDFKEEFGLSEMKLKFLNSKKLPFNFKWRKLFDSRSNKLLLKNKKYVITIGLYIEPNQQQYIWSLYNIQEIRLKKKVPDAIIYFHQILTPKLKQKYASTQYQDYVLYQMNIFLNYIEQMQFRRSLQQAIFENRNERSSNLQFKYNSNNYSIQFSQPYDDPKCSIFLTIKQYQKFSLQVIFEDNVVTALIKYDIIQLLCNHYKPYNIKKWVQSLSGLVSILKKYNKFNEKFKNIAKLLSRNIMIKWQGFFFLDRNQEYVDATASMKAEKDGVYISEVLYRTNILITISNKGTLSTEYIPSTFLNQLCQKFNESDGVYFFSCLYILEGMLASPKNHDCSLYEYTIKNLKSISKQSNSLQKTKQQSFLHLRFTKRACFQEQIIRSENGQYCIDEINFNSLGFKIQIYLDLSDVIFNGQIYRDLNPEFIRNYFIKQWNEYYAQKNEDPINVQILLKQIQYFQDHFVIKRIYDRKLTDQFKSIYKLNL